jgi:maltose alpha-D-glucosyltransferase/alpha-amylase
MTDLNDSNILGDPLWYKDAIIYELHVKAFCDSDGDGIGDFQGLTTKLDYLQYLGVTAIWLLPFFPSPLRDDGYDTSDYTGIHSSYGNMHDFKTFLREAHNRGLKVITELVLNHTSDQHPWFQRARRSPKGRLRDFYVWSDTIDKYSEARIIFKDFESSNWTWDPVAKSYYWHRFYSHQPDLNYDSPQVQRAMLKILDFWFSLGVDGLRLDAVPYLFEREGTNCENLPETHAFLKLIRAHIDKNFHNRMLLAEANQWPEDAVVYFGDGDMCQMAFHFPIMPRLFMALRMEDRFPLIDILNQTPKIPDNCQWALFLRNHDELTLEMVTEEERSYMYRAYAKDRQMRINMGIRRRLAPLMQNNRRRIELLIGLLFSLPGTPVLYYGDEIGMGDNVYLGDRNGVRTPMQWSADRNAGFSRCNPQQLFLPIAIDPQYHYESVNVEAQQSNPQSLLWWLKRMIALRKRFPAFGRGDIQFLSPENRKVLSFIRRFGDEYILVVANLSRFTQHTELDLHEHNGFIPVELFGGNEFPVIKEDPYFFTLGPHSFYWFNLIPSKDKIDLRFAGSATERLPIINVKSEDWKDVLNDSKAIESALLQYMKSRPTIVMRGNINSVHIIDIIPDNENNTYFICIVNVIPQDGDAEIQVLPLCCVESSNVQKFMDERISTIIARLKFPNPMKEAVIFDATTDPEFCRWILLQTVNHKVLKGTGKITTSSFSNLRRLASSPEKLNLNPHIRESDHESTIISFRDSFVLKLFRRIDNEIHPEMEMGQFLSIKKFKHTPILSGQIMYSIDRDIPMTMGVVHNYISNQGSAEDWVIDVLESYFELPLTHRKEIPATYLPRVHILESLHLQLPQELKEPIGTGMGFMELLGRRIAELHIALSDSIEETDFVPEPFSRLYQRSLYQTLRNRAGIVLPTLRKKMKTLPLHMKADGNWILENEKRLLAFYSTLSGPALSGKRIRCHGNLHLGQILLTGNDFMFVDFAGDPSRHLSERRIKRSPLWDIIGIVSSLYRASHSAILIQRDRGLILPENFSYREVWADVWCFWNSITLLRSYIEVMQTNDLLPGSLDQECLLFNILRTDKIMIELGNDLNGSPDWISFSLKAMRKMIETHIGTTVK